MNKLDVGRCDKRVLLSFNGKAIMGMPWQAADAIYHALKRQVKKARMFAIYDGSPSGSEECIKSGSTIVAIRQQGEMLLVIGNGKLLFDMTADISDKILSALYSQSRACEEWEKAEKIALDNAILFRAGAPFGLTNDPKIQEESIKEAVHNRNLRRWMPSIKSEEAVGTPTIRVGVPLNVQLKELASNMSPADRKAFIRSMKGKSNVSARS